MARKKRRSSPQRKQKRLMISTTPEVSEEKESQTIVFVNSLHFPMTPGAVPSQRSDTHFTDVAQRSS